MDPGRHVHCWLSNPPGQPQDLEDVVKLSKRLGRESRAQKGFRWEAPYITPANLRTSIGVNCDQLWQNKHCNRLCVDCPFTSRCSTAIFVIQGKFRETKEDTRHHIYLSRKNWSLGKLTTTTRSMCMHVDTPMKNEALSFSSFLKTIKTPQKHLDCYYSMSGRNHFTLVNRPHTNTSKTNHINFPWTAFMTEESSALTRSCSARKTLQRTTAKILLNYW